MVGEPQPKAGVAFVAFDYDTPLKQISLLAGYAKLRSNIVHSRPKLTALILLSAAIHRHSQFLQTWYGVQN